MIFRPMDENISLEDTKTSFVSYVDVLEPKSWRQKYLRQNYFFDCQCEQCSDLSLDYIQTSAVCEDTNCKGLINFDETTGSYSICNRCYTFNAPSYIGNQ